MRVEDLALLGEYTDASGPYADDYFFLFLNGRGERFGASFYLEGRAEFFQQLGEQLGSELRPGLANSTELASRVIWPEPLVDTELFDFVPVAQTSFWGRVRQRLFPEYEMRFSKGVKEHLASVSCS